ncbi:MULTISPECIES: sigma-70 family RNA polymerase sigma factor [Aneurinibacillus]|uniref:RNA polymerase sigma factor, sigma-70 family n=1 Tax=Aneurinibacillus thermoaerophilus TaxID=143495 RepID=A0A1G8C6M5_ANETH|nr:MULTISPECIES: sigma-70 family RNA polymerase sigma factor [Aneurinibacillus]AMA74441.1 hypothetical protein ACH33_17740 [Aneurinibacillus sp. XH2]MED0674529.1 sigma-70 family RNA polymerase sigma factor [Aneurinibacillus thermoaerophilus]MED0679163.1 sigma-70 family RNA polymerase sigma factor [Aneurinibacillus thermoaerophilus]MED0738237.1 sigma-70 family RNA polymerase sigma factor [Aneurinibacillus thermoaerophilus]MED0766061.1 sigma-70 family RNA polymerase sigma factor [Aneurinibacillu
MSITKFLRQDSHFKKDVVQFINDHPILLSNPILKNFLKEKKNLLLFIQAVSSSTKESKKKLDKSFKNYYLKIRLVNFMSKLLYYSAIDYDKKIRKHNQRYLLILDKPVQNASQDDEITIVDLIPSNEQPFDGQIIEKNNVLEEIISDPLLSKAIKRLTPKEKLIIELAYVHAMSDRTIAKKLCISHQAVSKTRKRAIAKIRSYMEERDVV